jgi:hypothetical protein
MRKYFGPVRDGSSSTEKNDKYFHYFSSFALSRLRPFAILFLPPNGLFSASGDSELPIYILGAVFCRENVKG